MSFLTIYDLIRIFLCGSIETHKCKDAAIHIPGYMITSEVKYRVMYVFDDYNYEEAII